MLQENTDFTFALTNCSQIFETRIILHHDFETVSAATILLRFKKLKIRSTMWRRDLPVKWDDQKFLLGSIIHVKSIADLKVYKLRCIITTISHIVASIAQSPFSAIFLLSRHTRFDKSLTDKKVEPDEYCRGVLSGTESPRWTPLWPLQNGRPVSSWITCKWPERWTRSPRRNWMANGGPFGLLTPRSLSRALSVWKRRWQLRNCSWTLTFIPEDFSNWISYCRPG